MCVLIKLAIVGAIRSTMDESESIATPSYYNFRKTAKHGNCNDITRPFFTTLLPYLVVLDLFMDRFSNLNHMAYQWTTSISEMYTGRNIEIGYQNIFRVGHGIKFFGENLLIVCLKLASPL
jgi:hypothetical protein